ncbi:MAG: putative phage abortive infection protein [Ignavibacteria bacterium]|nr:putative phage abortive infection protein [Ignavibacteria bacterium]
MTDTLSQPDQDIPKTPKSHLFLFILFAILVITVWYVFGWQIQDCRGRDMFQAVNSLFAGLAFAGLIYAILLQRNELSLQRTELAMTRRVLEGQEQQLIRQNQTLARQSLANTFFQLLRFHNDIVDAIDLRDPFEHAVTTRGRDCFSVFYRTRLRDSYTEACKAVPEATEQAKVERAYRQFFAANQANVGHYFRHLYHVFKFIKISEIEDKQFYANLVVAQLSSYELALLFYNGISPFGRERFKPLLEEYAVFENLDKAHIINKSHLEYYEGRAYGDL